MDLLELMKERRSIRKYQEKQIPKEDLEKIIEAGKYAPNAGGGQKRYIVGCQNKILNEKIGKLDKMSVDKSRFYGAPTVCTIFGPKDFLFSVPDCYVAAENMVLEAYNLGINSCIAASREEMFDSEFGKELLKEWNVPEDYIARCFVLLGYVDGPYPLGQPRKENSSIIID